MKEKLFEVLKTMRTGNRNLEDIAIYISKYFKTIYDKNYVWYGVPNQI